MKGEDSCIFEHDCKLYYENNDKKFEFTIRESSISTPKNTQKTNQAVILIHTIEDCQKFRDISFWNICQKWIGTSWLIVKKSIRRC